jgi:hypothetical protein
MGKPLPSTSPKLMIHQAYETRWATLMKQMECHAKGPHPYALKQGERTQAMGYGKQILEFISCFVPSTINSNM